MSQVLEVGFSEGSWALRKGERVQVVHVDRSLTPWAYTVKTEDGREISTEASRLEAMNSTPFNPFTCRCAAVTVVATFVVIAAAAFGTLGFAGQAHTQSSSAGFIENLRAQWRAREDIDALLAKPMITQLVAECESQQGPPVGTSDNFTSLSTDVAVHYSLFRGSSTNVGTRDLFAELLLSVTLAAAFVGSSSSSATNLTTSTDDLFRFFVVYNRITALEQQQLDAAAWPHEVVYRQVVEADLSPRRWRGTPPSAVRCDARSSNGPLPFFSLPWADVFDRAYLDMNVARLRYMWGELDALGVAWVLVLDTDAFVTSPWPGAFELRPWRRTRRSRRTRRTRIMRRTRTTRRTSSANITTTAATGRSTAGTPSTTTRSTATRTRGNSGRRTTPVLGYGMLARDPAECVPSEAVIRRYFGACNRTSTAAQLDRLVAKRLYGSGGGVSLLSVPFFAAPAYTHFAEYLEALGGFWTHRWSDHSIFYLAASALAPVGRNEEEVGAALPIPKALDMVKHKAFPEACMAWRMLRQARVLACTRRTEQQEQEQEQKKNRSTSIAAADDASNGDAACGGVSRTMFAAVSEFCDMVS